MMRISIDVYVENTQYCAGTDIVGSVEMDDNGQPVFNLADEFLEESDCILREDTIQEINKAFEKLKSWGHGSHSSDECMYACRSKFHGLTHEDLCLCGVNVYPIICNAIGARQQGDPKKIHFIKMLRQETGAGLKEAKDFYEFFFPMSGHAPITQHEAILAYQNCR